MTMKRNRKKKWKMIPKEGALCTKKNKTKQKQKKKQ